MRALIVGLVLALPLAFAPQAGAFIYWTGPNADGTASQIGRANLDGSNPQPGFIGIGSFQADSVAVDAHHIYWANMSLPPGISGVGTIAVANLDGSGVRARLVTTNGIPGGVGVHGG